MYEYFKIYNVSKNNFGFFVYNFLTFFNSEKKKSLGQREVCQGSRKSASGVKDKCIGEQGEMLPLNVWYSAEALLLDPLCTFP